ncbi:hypothetical protein M3Y99_00185600 [Aphelenchoides fujianensis]|nr:hypothetical protein M3Y99_00185600 [Aphelenchoides fujianensis]
MKTQMQYQHEIERLEKENKLLKQRLLLSDKGEQKRMKKLKRSLIDMYSEMLDILSDYDASYIAADNLPRVVVVGDQSAGKTSVLEMVAQARIFPRGSGEMMTRAPVKVTLSEGPYHIAQFRNSSREFDLTNESDLEQLRNEIELRMRNSVADGKTVSNEVISLTVKGPNLPRIVLVDLPGIISTVTADMARETKDDIIRMCRQHMENPNSIILCIQDGSVDAERSNVTELVSRMNPSGDRTILVLTKVDLAEKNMNDPGRIKKILEGKLFPMKAIGYLAWSPARTRRRLPSRRSAATKEEFFENSKLFKEGILKPSQMTTRNMSIAVSDCFWRMVRDTIEAQADSFRAARFNLETEWKNTFPRIRELDRDELFDKARSEILDEVVNLSLLQADEWDHILSEKLLSVASEHVFDQILLPTFSVTNAGAFKTAVDIRLKHWAEKELANLTVNVGWDSFKEVLEQQIEGRTATGDSIDSELFKPLKKAVVEAILQQHRWDQKASEYLKVIQLNAIGDQNIPDRKTWEAACEFMRNAVQRHLEKTREALHSVRGPGVFGKWLKWQTPTYDHVVSENLQDELRKILNQDENHTAHLTDEDVTIVRRGLETKQLNDVPTAAIQREWAGIFREHYLERLLQASNDCLSFYQSYKQDLSNEAEVDCQAVVLFHRLKKMLDLSTNALRQQITNTEQRRLEKEDQGPAGRLVAGSGDQKDASDGQESRVGRRIDGKMASTLTVKVHPVVYMSMVDAYERRINRKQTNDRALGTLLGFYEKNVVQITNCYSIPFREAAGNIDMDDAFNKQMLSFYRRATPSEQVVGWFITMGEPTDVCQRFHTYYSTLVSEMSVKKELPPIVLLTLDVSAEGKDGAFQPLKVELDSFAGEDVALSLVEVSGHRLSFLLIACSLQNGVTTLDHGVKVDSSLEQLRDTSGEMVHWLERVLNYVEEVLAKPEPTAEDSAMGRKLMGIVTTAATHLQADKLDGLVKSSIRDLMMISYLSTLAKTQLGIQEKLLGN